MVKLIMTSQRGVFGNVSQVMASDDYFLLLVISVDRIEIAWLSLGRLSEIHIFPDLATHTHESSVDRFKRADAAECCQGETFFECFATVTPVL